MATINYVPSGITTASVVAGDANSNIRSITPGLLTFDHITNSPLSDVSVTAPTSAGGGTSLINDGANNVFKSLAATHPISISDAGGLITISDALQSTITAVYTADDVNSLYTSNGKHRIFDIINDKPANGDLSIIIPGVTSPATSTTMSPGDEIVVYYASGSSSGCVILNEPVSAKTWTIRKGEAIKFYAISVLGDQVIYGGQTHMDVGTSADSFIATNNTISNNAQSSVIIGSDCNGSSNSVVLGKFALFNNPSPPIDLVAIGTLAMADTASSVGRGCVAIGINSGRYWSNSADYAIAIGGDAARNNSAISQNRDYSISIGVSSTYTDGGALSSIAIGRNANFTSSGTYSIAIGDNSSADQDYSISIGRNTTVGQAYDISIGDVAACDTTSNEPGIAIGRNTTARRLSTVLGHSATTSANNRFQVALGCTANASRDGDVAIGFGSTAENTNVAASVAIGYQAQALGNGIVAIGNNALTIINNQNMIVIGNAAEAGRTDDICIGAGGLVRSTGASGSLGIGRAVDVQYNDCLVIGKSAVANSNTTTIIGNGASAGASNQVVIGPSASATAGVNSIVLGALSSSTSSNTLALGYNVTINNDNSFVVKSTSYAVTQSGARSGVLSCANRDVTLTEPDKIVKCADSGDILSMYADTSGVRYTSGNISRWGNSSTKSTTGNVTGSAFAEVFPVTASYAAILSIKLIGSRTSGAGSAGDTWTYLYGANINGGVGTLTITNKSTIYVSEVSGKSLNTADPLGIVNSSGNAQFTITTTGLTTEVISWVIAVEATYCKFA